MYIYIHIPLLHIRWDWWPYPSLSPHHSMSWESWRRRAGYLPLRSKRSALRSLPR